MSESTMPEAGTPAPDFSGIAQNGDTLSLKDYSGQRLVLYFYPRDNTPGCTRQACNLRDNYQSLKDAGIAIIGVSDDSEVKHDKFIAKHDLPFPLISDTDRTIMTAYGTYGEKKNYGRVYMGTKRTTFLIEKDGTIKHVIRKPKVGQHAEEIMKWFNS
jgi:thioredoxin-dependent peroxiredoxin